MLVELQGRKGKFSIESTAVKTVWQDSDEEVGIITADCGKDEYYPVVGKEQEVKKVLGIQAAAQAAQHAAAHKVS